MPKLLKIAIGTFAGAFLLQLVVCNHMAVKTRELNLTALKIVELQNQISIIKQEIYLASAIVDMEQKARAYGFARTELPVKTITNPTIARAL
ncbi:hypothetical protein KJ605_01260 [Patescibacteria group bacterium]|nr:hypothetical protein [Patescibacteria group bacterium]MBU1970387.1 hypothetical protein [Patescibacteria group bacterium]